MLLHNTIKASRYQLQPSESLFEPKGDNSVGCRPSQMHHGISSQGIYLQLQGCLSAQCC